MTRLETFDSPDWGGHRTVCTFETDELTAHCPFDFGGPDHYSLTIKYRPLARCIESKSLKEFLQSFRDKEISAERLANEIHAEIDAAVNHDGLLIRLEQARRGGIEETVEVGEL